MNCICARACRYVDSAGRCELRREVHRRLTELELLNSAGRNVHCGGAENLVGDVDAINFDSSRFSEAATD